MMNFPKAEDRRLDGVTVTVAHQHAGETCLPPPLRCWDEVFGVAAAAAGQGWYHLPSAVPT